MLGACSRYLLRPSSAAPASAPPSLRGGGVGGAGLVSVSEGYSARETSLARVLYPGWTGPSRPVDRPPPAIRGSSARVGLPAHGEAGAGHWRHSGAPHSTLCGDLVMPPAGPLPSSHWGSTEAVRCRPMERAQEAREETTAGSHLHTTRGMRSVRARPLPLSSHLNQLRWQSIKFPGPLRIGDLRVSRNTPERNFVAARGRAAAPRLLCLSSIE